MPASIFADVINIPHTETSFLNAHRLLGPLNIVGSEVIGLPGGMDNQELWPLIEAWGVVLAPQKQ